MKKIRILAVSLAAIVVLAVASLTMAGCGSSTLESIGGTTWKVTSMKVNGTDYMSTLTSAGSIAGYTDIEIDFIFNEDGSCEMVMSYKDSSGNAQTQNETGGSYTYENGKLSIEGQEASLNGNTATFSLTASGMDMDITIEKK